MRQLKTTRVVRWLILVFVVGLTALAPAGAAFAADPPKIETRTLYPTVTGIAGTAFTFQVDLLYYGDVARTFDLAVVGPTGWDIKIKPGYDQTEKQISAIYLEPVTVVEGQRTYGETIDIVATPPNIPVPDIGEYKLSLTAMSDTITTTTDLTAKVTGSYSMTITPVAQVYNINASAGIHNYYSIDLTNTGTAPLTNIQFYSDKAQGWQVGVTVAGIDKLEPGDHRVIDLAIVPPEKNIAGDYYVTFRAQSNEAAAAADIRVTVQTPTTWGWIGLVLIGLVVGGLGYVYIAFRRR